MTGARDIPHENRQREQATTHQVTSPCCLAHCVSAVTHTSIAAPRRFGRREGSREVAVFGIANLLAFAIALTIALALKSP